MKLKQYIYYNYNYSKLYNIYINSLIGKLLKQGRKDLIIKKFFYFKFLIKFKIKKDINFILFLALLNSLVKIHFIKKRFGGTRKELPLYINNRRQVTFACNNLIKFSYSKRNKLINFEKIFENIINTSEKKGFLIKKIYKEYKKALDNRVFLNYVKKKKKL
jgi:ribosomal protein S7